MTPAATGSDLRAVARGSGVNLVGAAVSTLANVGLIVVLAHQLPRRDAGAFFAATSLFLLLSTAAGLGTSTASVYFLPRLRQAGDVAGIHRLLRVALWPVTLVSTGCVVLLLSLPRSVGQAVGTDGRHHGLDLLWVLAFALPFATLADLFQAGTRGFGRMRTTVLVERIGRPLIQLAAVIAAAATGNLPLVALAWALPYLPAAAVSLRALTRLRGRAGPLRATALAGGDGFGRVYWSYSLPRALSGIAALALQRLDIVLVATLRGPADAAVYTAATRFLVVGQFLGQSILLALQPRVSALLGTDRRQEAQALYRVTTAWLMVLTWPLYVSVAVFPNVFLAIFGHGYRSGAAVVVVLAASMLLATIIGQVDVMISMGGRSGYSLLNVSLALAVNVTLNLVLIPPYGITGAAVAWGAAIATNNLIALLELRLLLGIHPFGGTTIRTGLAAAACFGLPGLAAATGSGPAAQLAAYLVGSAAYLLWLWAARDRLHLAELAGQVTARYRRSR